MALVKVIKGTVYIRRDGKDQVAYGVGEGFDALLPAEQHLFDNGFVELATPESAPSVEVVVEPAPVAKQVAVAPPAAVKGKK